jgi:hypothetical protein
MKKAQTRSAKDPTAASLREMPELDLRSYRVKPNRFAARIAREGIVVAHEGPSRTSLEAIPEADFSSARVRKNPYMARIRRAGIVVLQVGRGRPRRGAETGPTVTKSVRLPPAVWAKLEKRARGEGIAMHALLRRALLELAEGVA